MKRNIICFLFALLFILSGALAAYSECVGVDRHADFATEHETLSLHCTNAILDPAIQANSGIRFHSDNFGKSLQAPQPIIDNVVLALSSKHDSFHQPFSQRALFCFLEVYRL